MQAMHLPILRVQFPERGQQEMLPSHQVAGSSGAVLTNAYAHAPSTPVTIWHISITLKVPSAPSSDTPLPRLLRATPGLISVIID